MITQYTILSDDNKTMVKWTALVSITLLKETCQLHLLFDHDIICKVDYDSVAEAQVDTDGLNAILGAQDLSTLIEKLEAFRLAEQQKALPEPQAQATATTEQGEAKVEGETNGEGASIAGRINCTPKDTEGGGDGGSAA